MEKIDFVNAQEPAINDTNLNRMQLNIENAINAQVSGDTLPVGCIVPFTSDTVPENWLLCNGSAVSRTEYDLLFSIIGTNYGEGDGSTTFNLPNLKGRVAVGKDSTQTEFDNLGEIGGEKAHTQTVAEMPSHNHTLGSNYGNVTAMTHIDAKYGFMRDGAYIDRTLAATSSNENIYTTGNTGGGQPMNNLQPYQVTNYIIKAKQSAGIVATVVDGLNSTSTTDAFSANQGRVLNEKFDYSTTESIIGTWINGEIVYRKVYSSNGTTGNTVEILHNISNLKNIVRAEIFATNNKGFNYINDNEIYPLRINQINETKIIANISEAFSQGWIVYYILEYTKLN